MTVPNFDFRAPDYGMVFRRRLDLIRKMRDPETGAHTVALLKAFYKLHPWQFVEDFGMTFDPRNLERDLPATIPFIPFPRQVELMEWIHGLWRRGKDGAAEKARDTGASWCAIALSCTLCLFYEGMTIGFGSRKEEYVDRLDSPKSLFFKARIFMKNLPVEFRGGWSSKVNGAFMRLTFPESGSVMTGEAGDNIGRGDRCAIYFVDEAAHLERPALVEASLSATTNCRIDMSSVNGMSNPFAEKTHGKYPKDQVFSFGWRSDPRKDDAWYANQVATKDPIVVAQEIDMNYSASVTGVVIPNEWVQAAVDAHIKLGLSISGRKSGGLDVADEGKDLNAFAARHGVLLFSCEAWSGKGSDIYATTEKAQDRCADYELDGYRYDADGLGAGVRGDEKRIQAARSTNYDVTPFRGSGAVYKPDDLIEQVDPDKVDPLNPETRTNKDYFLNAKAQAWWALRFRFLRTFRWVTMGHACDPDMIISISSTIPDITKICLELSQPTYDQNGAGKLLIDKAPDGQRSPNYADAINIAFAPSDPPKKGFFDF